MDAKTIGEAITQQRTRLGLTQIALAERAGISRRTLIALEAGEADIGLRRLLRVLQALDLALTLTSAARPTEDTARQMFAEDDE